MIRIVWLGFLCYLEQKSETCLTSPLLNASYVSSYNLYMKEDLRRVREGYRESRPLFTKNKGLVYINSISPSLSTFCLVATNLHFMQLHARITDNDNNGKSWRSRFHPPPPKKKYSTLLPSKTTSVHSSRLTLLNGRREALKCCGKNRPCNIPFVATVMHVLR